MAIVNLVIVPSTGGEVPIEAVWAGVAVVLVSALIAAATSYMRTRMTMKGEGERLTSQLDAEQRRVDAQLEAESARQLESLSHDRTMRDIDEIMLRLDEVIDMGEAALSAVCSAREAHIAGDVGAVVDQLAQARECLGQSGYKERRLRLRIGIEHAAMTALVGYREKIQALLDLVKRSSEGGGAISAADWNKAIGQVGAAQVKVIAVGRATVGARIT